MVGKDLGKVSDGEEDEAVVGHTVADFERSTVEVMKRPSNTEREAATLYLTDLDEMKKNGDGNSDLLRFFAKVKTSHSKTRSAYTLMDPGASHCYIDSNYARQLGLPLRHAGKISIITAVTKHPTSE